VSPSRSVTGAPGCCSSRSTPAALGWRPTQATLLLVARSGALLVRWLRGRGGRCSLAWPGGARLSVRWVPGDCGVRCPSRAGWLRAESGVVMGARWMSRSAAVVAVVVVWGGVLAGGALAAVTPGWECVPTTAGQAVVSGGAGATPSCGGNETAVLAPTYVSSGVGGKPTVKFSAVNVQILNGAGSTASLNGTGNMVVGYDENPS